MNLLEKYDPKNEILKEHFSNQGKLSPVLNMELSRLISNSLNLQERVLTETTVSQDIATFSQILMPIIRQVYPRLIASHLLGVQPMSGPTGYIYSLVSRMHAKDSDEQVK